MSKEDTQKSCLLYRAMITEDYASAIDIITSKDFNPNEYDNFYKMPVLCNLIEGLNVNKTHIKDQKSMKEILTLIVNHESFNPNVFHGWNTPLMTIAICKDFNFLVPAILSKKNVDLSIKRSDNEDVFSIANRFNNDVLLGMLFAYKEAHKDANGMPRKRVGIKPIKKVTESTASFGQTQYNRTILERIEYAFSEEQKNNPASLYWMMMFFLTDRYNECLKIIKNPLFDPNEKDRWGEPVITSLIYYAHDSRVNYNEDKFREIIKEIINCSTFDVNAMDADCNTPIMVAMGYKNLHWLVEILFNMPSVKLNLTNDEGETLKDIAKYSGGEPFYNALISTVPTAVEVV